jgi:hypothetical protein
VEVGDTLTRTAFSEPGQEIDGGALRDIYEGLRELFTHFPPGLRTHASVEEVELQLYLPERYAMPFARALIAADVAWRIGWMAAEGDDGRLGTSDVGSVNLDEILPIEECGLEIVAIEAGSIKAKLRAAKDKVSYDSAIATMALLLQFGSGIGFVGPAPAEEPQLVQPIPTAVHQKVGPSAGELPSLPQGTRGVVEVKLSDGTIVRITAPDT